MNGEIFWIDDKGGLFPTGAAKERIEEACDAVIRPIEASQETLDEVLASLAHGVAVKLIVLDYWLANLPKENGDAAGTKNEFGSTWAAALRAEHPEVPIAGVTSETIGDVPDSQKSQFLQLLNRDKILDELHDSDLRSLIDGFPKVYSLWMGGKHELASNKRIPMKVNVESSTIVQLLVPAEGTKDYLESVLPEFAKQPWDKETPHEFSRWVIEVLLRRPGFLFDSLEVATFLGLDEAGFRLVASLFDRAKYTGVYASENRPRWWTNQIRPVFTEVIGQQMEGALREHRMKLLSLAGITDAQFLSKAYTLEDTTEIPDCVAFDDETRQMEKRVQSRIRDTEIDPQENPPLGFEARRIWRGIAREDTE